MAAALKLSIRDILNAKQFESGIVVDDNPVSRINLIATLVVKEPQDQLYIIDDASGSIALRTFGNENRSLASLEVGTILSIIGRVRIFDSERYVSAEVVCPVDKKMRKLRSLELELRPKPKEEAIAEVENYSDPLSMLELIRRVDALNNGKGADVVEIVKRSNSDNTQEILTRLLELGEIFEIRPGKLKVLD